MVEHSRKSGLRDYVYEHVKQLLLEGGCRPGTQILVEKLASDLEVSRQPVMDALKRLEFEGFVSIIPQVGCRVRSYRPNEVQDFFLVVAEAEALVAGLAARRAKPDDIVRMQLISGQIGNIAKTPRSAGEKAKLYRSLNRQLHAEFGRAANSEPVAELVRSLGDRSDFFIASAEQPIFFERLQQAHGEHEAIIAAIQRGDDENASRIMRVHILAIEKRLRKPSLESVS
jgi:DNA-binding GntR family transcriptional regulator